MSSACIGGWTPGFPTVVEVLDGALPTPDASDVCGFPDGIAVPVAPGEAMHLKMRNDAPETCVEFPDECTLKTVTIYETTGGQYSVWSVYDPFYYSQTPHATIQHSMGIVNGTYTFVYPPDAGPTPSHLYITARTDIALDAAVMGVVTVPEPGGASLIAGAIMLALLFGRRKRKSQVLLPG